MKNELHGEGGGVDELASFIVKSITVGVFTFFLTFATFILKMR
jgi:hypothetical protein